MATKPMGQLGGTPRVVATGKEITTWGALAKIATHYYSTNVGAGQVNVRINNAY